MKHLFYPLVCGLFILAGCSNDDETQGAFVLAGDYQAATTVVTAPIALYTKDGLVNNPTLVDNLLRRRSLNTPGYFSRVDAPVTGNGLKLSINSSGQALLISTYPTRTDTVKASVGNQTASSFTLTNADSIVAISPGSASFFYRCDLLAGNIKAVYPVKHCRAVSVSSGTVSQACGFRPVKLIEIRGGQLFVPIFSWFVETGQPTTCGTAAGGEWNTFNPAILNQLVAGDTIVVQTKSVALTRI